MVESAVAGVATTGVEAGKTGAGAGSETMALVAGAMATGALVDNGAAGGTGAPCSAAKVEKPEARLATRSISLVAFILFKVFVNLFV